ncbi:hypothetical protein [Bosea sp. (in: a-proteobacteria)]|uniref:hypothetical protein n=1 Tax=Bosea sp. (in: a-proteobacteria) TaxID=1871050 RepID=UPI0031FECCD2
MAKRPRQDREKGLPGQPPGGDASPIKAGADRARTPSAEADDAVLHLARLIGRQIAREQFESKDRILPRPRAKGDKP